MDVTFRRPVKTEGLLPRHTPLPLIVEPVAERGAEALASWVGANRELLGEKLRHHGAILFRQFEITTPEDFEVVAEAVDPELLTVDRFDDSMRKWLTAHVYEVLDSDVTRQHSALSLHNENSFLPLTPGRVMFCCLCPPDIGGETPLVDCRAVFRALPERVRQRYIGQYLWSRVHRSARLTTYNFRTTDAVEIEAACRAVGGQDVVWSECDGLDLDCNVPAVIRDSESGEGVWFNRVKNVAPLGTAFEKLLSATAFSDPRLRMRSLLNALRFSGVAARIMVFDRSYEQAVKSLRFADGSPIPLTDQFIAAWAYWKNAVIIRWRRGDILVIENHVMAHGRMPFSGVRRVVACASMLSEAELYVG
jgi:alpha-ketoglutarate-dependent taurine dioxygenase